MAVSALQRLTIELGDLTPEELAVVLPEAARMIAAAPHWRGGRRDIASLLRRAGHRARCICDEQREKEAA